LVRTEKMWIGRAAAYPILEDICKIWSASLDGEFNRCAPPYEIVELIRIQWGRLSIESRGIVGLHADIPHKRQLAGVVRARIEKS
jgi:hypothetical protein